jgi:lipopolysaccharide/colanic/teichoic acid biosynthesis glycosyltransferase
MRVGKDGKMFGLYKFATMLKDSPKIGSGLLTVKNDPRVFPLGRILRKMKINELPQIINILLGDMSIVGRRPQVKIHFDLYPYHIRTELIKTKPGLTSIGSIIFRDEETIMSQSELGYEESYKNLIAPYKGELELWYVKKSSLSLYFVLIFLTVWVILFPKSLIAWKLFKDLPEPPENLNLK